MLCNPHIRFVTYHRIAMVNAVLTKLFRIYFLYFGKSGQVDVFSAVQCLPKRAGNVGHCFTSCITEFLIRIEIFSYVRSAVIGDSFIALTGDDNTDCIFPSDIIEFTRGGIVIGKPYGYNSLILGFYCHILAATTLMGGAFIALAKSVIKVSPNVFSINSYLETILPRFYCIFAASAKGMTAAFERDLFSGSPVSFADFFFYVPLFCRWLFMDGRLGCDNPRVDVNLPIHHETARCSFGGAEETHMFCNPHIGFVKYHRIAMVNARLTIFSSCTIAISASFRIFAASSQLMITVLAFVIPMAFAG